MTHNIGKKLITFIFNYMVTQDSRKAFASAQYVPSVNDLKWD